MLPNYFRFVSSFTFSRQKPESLNFLLLAAGYEIAMQGHIHTHLRLHPCIME